MGWKTPCILMLLLLGGAASPADECLAGTGGKQTLPMALDLAGRPSAPAGLTGQTFATLPGSEGGLGCRGALQYSSQSTTLRSESGDVLHGLPAPEILRPVNEPRRAPQFQ
jgi:hypothetical protein